MERKNNFKVTLKLIIGISPAERVFFTFLSRKNIQLQPNMTTCTINILVDIFYIYLHPLVRTDLEPPVTAEYLVWEISMRTQSLWLSQNDVYQKQEKCSFTTNCKKHVLVNINPNEALRYKYTRIQNAVLQMSFQENVMQNFFVCLIQNSKEESILIQICLMVFIMA